MRPVESKAPVITALPYDVYNKNEARIAVRKAPDSFLAIDRPEAHFPENADIYAPAVYRKAAELLQGRMEAGDFIQDDAPGYYVWELTMDGRAQTGLAACVSAEDYRNGIVCRHENTRLEKEHDRICHIEACSAQTGPVLLVHRSCAQLKERLAKIKEEEPLYDFTDFTGVGHRIWRTADPENVAEITKLGEKAGTLYIADGHHRAAASAAIAEKRKRLAQADETSESQYFLMAMFPEEEMLILDYNRLLKSLNGLTEETALESVKAVFEVSDPQEEPCRPRKKGEIGMCLGGMWYRLRIPEERYGKDPVSALDVEYLQKQLLEPVFGIKEPGADPRIEFVGGDRSMKELEHRCHVDAACAFVMYPTSMQELMAVADAGMLMPPKSTWFEPKLRTGLFIHRIEPAG